MPIILTTFKYVFYIALFSSCHINNEKTDTVKDTNKNTQSKITTTATKQLAFPLHLQANGVEFI